MRIAGKCAAYAGIFTAFMLVILIAIAIANFSGYSPSRNYLSDLGTKGTSSAFFNTGVAAAGFAAAFFGLWACRNVFSTRPGRIGGIVIAAAGIALAGVGMFPGENIFHPVFASMFFVLMASSMLLMALEFRNRFRMLTILLFVPALAFFALRTPLMEHISVTAILMWSVAANIHLARKYELEISRIRDGLLDALDAR